MKSGEKVLVDGTFDRGIIDVEKMFKALITYFVNILSTKLLIMLTELSTKNI